MSRSLSPAGCINPKNTQMDDTEVVPPVGRWYRDFFNYGRDPSPELRGARARPSKIFVTVAFPRDWRDDLRVVHHLFCYFLLLCGLPIVAHAADLFPDDHGDTVDTATAVAIPLTNGVTVSGRIEIDTDQDWFRFIALPDTVYRIQAQVTTLWDMELEFRGPHTTRLVRATSSALSTAPAKVTLTWTNTGAAGPYYAGIRGYLAFTTGTYSFAVTPLDVEDEDDEEDGGADGMPDSWEWSQFGELAQTPDGDADGDGFSNISEFYARTDPTNPASALFLSPRTTPAGVATVNWPAVPDSVYRVWLSTNLLTGSWIPMDLLYHPVGGGTNLQWNKALDGPQEFYKVELFMDP